MTTFKIRPPSKLPPKTGSHDRKSEIRKTIEKLAVGESFVVGPYSREQSVRVSMYMKSASAALGRRYSQRRVDNDICVWRIK